MENPLGLEERPDFGWQMQDDENKYRACQTAYRIVVAEINVKFGPHARKTFNVEKPVKKARIYATERGIYEMQMNGMVNTPLCSNQYGTEISFLAKLVITYTDGSEETIVSDPSWKCYDKGR